MSFDLKVLSLLVWLSINQNYFQWDLIFLMYRCLWLIRIYVSWIAKSSFCQNFNFWRRLNYFKNYVTIVNLIWNVNYWIWHGIWSFCLLVLVLQIHDVQQFIGITINFTIEFQILSTFHCTLHRRRFSTKYTDVPFPSTNPCPRIMFTPILIAILI